MREEKTKLDCFLVPLSPDLLLYSSLHESTCCHELSWNGGWSSIIDETHMHNGISEWEKKMKYTDCMENVKVLHPHMQGALNNRGQNESQPQSWWIGRPGSLMDGRVPSLHYPIMKCIMSHVHEDGDSMTRLSTEVNRSNTSVNMTLSAHMTCCHFQVNALRFMMSNCWYISGPSMFFVFHEMAFLSSSFGILVHCWEPSMMHQRRRLLLHICWMTMWSLMKSILE